MNAYNEKVSHELSPVTLLGILNEKKLQVSAWKIRRFEAVVPAEAQIYHLLCDTLPSASKLLHCQK